MMRTLRALSVAVALLALVGLVPLVLAMTIGNPLHGWNDFVAGDLNNMVVVDLLVLVVWAAWAEFAVSVIIELAVLLGHLPATARVPLVPNVSRHAARTMIATVLLLGATSSALASPSDAISRASVLLAEHPSMGGLRSDVATTDAPEVRVVVAALPTVDPGGAPYVVPADGQGPDTYWDIAVERLGSGERWQQVWDLNRGRVQSDGEVMTSPGLLKAGWTILLPQPVAGAPAEPDDVHAAAADDVVVRPGDTLSGIAHQHGLEDWREIWDSNDNRPEPHGARFRTPDLIRPGWTLTLPAPGDLVVNPGQPPDETQPPRAESGTDAQPTIPPPVAATLTPESEPLPPMRAPQSLSPSKPETQPVSATDSDAASIVILGGGVTLAAMSLAALLRYRRRQQRWRSPGRMIATTPSHLRRAERDLIAAGSSARADTTWLDQALRGLAHAQAATLNGQLPDVIAARLTQEALELHLATSMTVDVPSPWNADASGTRWILERADNTGYVAAARDHHLAPYPMLVCVGHTASDEQVFLDLEGIAVLDVSGDLQRCENFLRFLACELAHNAWSDTLRVSMVGFGQEITAINPDRLSYFAGSDEVPGELHYELASSLDESVHRSAGSLDSRLRDTSGDVDAPRVFLIADAGPLSESKDLAALIEAFGYRAERSGRAIVTAGGTAGQTRARSWSIRIDEQGLLTIPALDIELVAHGVAASEAEQLAQLLAFAATAGDVPVAVAAGDRPWDEFSNADGSIRSSLEPPQETEESPLRLATEGDRDANSVLSLPVPVYLDRTAATARDIESLAPVVDQTSRGAVHESDPDLDRDLADWNCADCARPKVWVLGPVAVSAQGPLPERNPRILWHTEIVAYLATRSRGVTAETYGADLWPNDPDISGKTKVRQSVSLVRQWLGANPATGQYFLPKAPAAGQESRYRLEGVLVDAELFRRLRLRGTARGSDGIDDLRAALELVTGVPFSERRPEGFGWLVEDSLDHIYTAMIVDVAHLVATHYLAIGEPELAVAAAQVALRSGSTEDVPLLDMVAASDAQNNRAEASAYVRRIMANHNAEVEEDLPPRTAEVLRRRQWLPNAG